MKLYERFADKGYHTSVATTFGVDFDAYESIALSRLRGAGCRNNMLVTDGRMLIHALSGASDLPQRAGTHYTVSGAAVTGGVFHPKLFLQFGRRGGRMIVGSANLTPAGLAGNLELVDAITCEESASGEQQLIAQAWDFVSGFIDGRRQSVADQRAWVRARTPWLELATRPTGPVVLADGTLAALLTSDPASGIADRFVALVDRPVRRLIVISPYWDPNLAVLSQLAQRLEAHDIAVLVDPQTREFPKDAIGGLTGLTLYDRGTFREGRYIHAKAIIAQTDDADHLLLGSANCTRAALGAAGFAGSNAEACLYRRLPPDGILGALELMDVLTEETIIAPDSLDPPEFHDNLPLDELGRVSAGQFECQGDTLRWHPPAIRDPAACSITLLDEGARPLACTLKPLAGHHEDGFRYEMSGSSRHPTFARVTFPDGRVSPPAIVSWIDKLRIESRETRRSVTQRRIDDLEGAPDASLALLELLNELENLERDQNAPREPFSVPRSRRDDGNEAESSSYRILSYDEFVSGRRPRTSASESSYNSLAGSDVAIVRGILNRIVGLGHAGDQRDHNQDHDRRSGAFDLGDETDDPEAALAAGHEFGTQRTEPEEDASAEDKQRRRARQRRATHDELVKVVDQFRADLKSRQSQGEALTNFDLVRLRVLLMILSTAASPLPRGRIATGEQAASLRVLPVEGDENSWPVLMGRLLFAMFGGKRPAIRQLHLTNEHDQIPGDFNECWGTCYWCSQACLQAPLSKPERQRIASLLTGVARTALLLTLPSKEELLSDEIISVMDRMSERYAGELRIDPVAIRAGHRALVEAVFGEAGS